MEVLPRRHPENKERERGKKREKRDLRNLDPVGGVAVDDRTRGVLGLEKVRY